MAKKKPESGLRRKLDRWLWGARQLLLHGRPTIAFAFYGGAGDALMMSAVLHAWKACHPGSRIWAITDFPELLAPGPHCDHAVVPGHAIDGFVRRLRVPVRALNYSARDESTDRDVPPPGHLIATMARLAGVRGIVELLPRIHLTPSEMQRGNAAAGAVCIQSTASNARYPIATKEWGADRFACVVAALRLDGLRVIQLGASHDPILPGAEDYRGRTSFREAAALLANSRLFIGLISGLMHIARAVNCRSVIVYGGRETPEQSGYPGNINLVRRPPCSPCWLWSRCDHRLECLTAIPPEEVINSVRQALAAPPAPMPVATAMIE